MKFYFREIFRPNAKIPIHSQKTRSVSVLRLRGIRGSGSGSECARLSLCGAGVHGVGIMSTLLERGTDRFCITSTGPVISQLLKSWPHFHQRATAPPSSGHAGSSGNCDVKHNHRLFLLKSASEILSLANNAAVSLSQTHTKLNAKNPKRETFGYFYRRYTVYILHASRFIAQW